MTESAWDWVMETYPDGIRLMFVRRAAPEQIFGVFDADPATARMLTAEATHETVPYPWARVGRTGEWAFSIDSRLLNLYEFDPQARHLSAGTELALLEQGLGTGYFYYYADAEEVTSFEPLKSSDRHGTDPDRFVPQMRQTGLDVERPPDDADLTANPTTELLHMLTLALGIRLSGQQALGPLLTAHLLPP